MNGWKYLKNNQSKLALPHPILKYVYTMKITKRHGYTSPAATINIWFIPTMAYTIQKVGGVQFNEYEWVWWAGIPMLVATWFLMNFKITK